MRFLTCLEGEARSAGLGSGCRWSSRQDGVGADGEEKIRDDMCVEMCVEERSVWVAGYPKGSAGTQACTVSIYLCPSKSSRCYV